MLKPSPCLTLIRNSWAKVTFIRGQLGWCHLKRPKLDTKERLHLPPLTSNVFHLIAVMNILESTVDFFLSFSACQSRSFHQLPDQSEHSYHSLNSTNTVPLRKTYLTPAEGERGISFKHTVMTWKHLDFGDKTDTHIMYTVFFSLGLFSSMHFLKVKSPQAGKLSYPSASIPVGVHSD